MSETVIGGLITAAAMIVVAIVSGAWAYRNKRTPEPTPVETLWARLDTQDDRIEKLRSRVDDQDDHITKLQSAVAAYRGGFLAHVSWAQRIREQWTGSIPIVAFTPEEAAAIRRGLELSDLEDHT